MAANGSASKNLAMLMATGTYKGLKSIGRSIRDIPKRIKRVNDLKEQKNIKILEENFGNVENYEKLK